MTFHFAPDREYFFLSFTLLCLVLGNSEEDSAAFPPSIPEVCISLPCEVREVALLLNVRTHLLFACSAPDSRDL